MIKLTDVQVENLLWDFCKELSKSKKGFFTESTSGCCGIVDDNGNTSHYCTPFWEDEPGIPVDVIVNDDVDFSYIIKHDKPTTAAELENFKEFYIKMVNMLINNNKK